MESYKIGSNDMATLITKDDSDLMGAEALVILLGNNDTMGINGRVGVRNGSRRKELVETLLLSKIDAYQISNHKKTLNNVVINMEYVDTKVMESKSQPFEDITKYFKFFGGNSAFIFSNDNRIPIKMFLPIIEDLHFSLYNRNNGVYRAFKENEKAIKAANYFYYNPNSLFVQIYRRAFTEKKSIINEDDVKFWGQFERTFH